MHLKALTGNRIRESVVSVLTSYSRSRTGSTHSWDKIKLFTLIAKRHFELLYMIDTSSWRHQICKVYVSDLILIRSFSLIIYSVISFQLFYFDTKSFYDSSKIFPSRTQQCRFRKGFFSSIYFCHWKLPCTSLFLWLHDATEIRTVFSSRFSLRVEFHLYWIHYCTYYLRLTFFGWTSISCIRSDDETSLYGSTFCRDLSFRFLNLSICLRRRCYRRFCSSNMILFFFP